MSGRILAERLQLLRPSLPVVFMSGYTDDAVLHHGVGQSEVHLLHKPISPERLVECVVEMLRGLALTGHPGASPPR
jgi:two-component system, cell cycle sensor histidine kinase and response regulator CckA